MNTETGERRRGFARRVALDLGVFVTLSTPAAAFAHGDEGMVPARDSVLQAIAYLVNTPDDRDMIEDKIKDAQESTDKEGVDASKLDGAGFWFSPAFAAQTPILIRLYAAHVCPSPG